MSPGSTEIGATLRDARRRYGMEVREVEDRTKIRARYIRALENEDWETLPAPAYVRGFLRTYGQLLGLDGEMLADEYRRRLGTETAPAGPGPSEPVLSEPRRPGERPPSRGPLIVAVLVGIVVLLLLLSLLGGGDEDPGDQPARGDRQTREAERKARKRQEQRQEKAAAAKQKKQESQLQKEDVKLVARSNVQVCLLGGGDEVLIDNQVLAVGAEEAYSGSKSYRLTIGPGSVKFVVGDNKQTLEASEPASFEGDSQGIRETNYRGEGCP